MGEKKILLVNPNFWTDIYGKSKVKVARSRALLCLGLAAVAAPLLEDGHFVDLIDLNISPTPEQDLLKKLEVFNPDYVGVNMTTPLFFKAKNIATIVKKHNPKICTVTGGPHPTVMPEEIIDNTDFDIAVIGEGDYTFLQIVQNKLLDNIDGIAYRDKSSKIIVKKPTSYIEDLDSLPMPALHLYDVPKYRKTPLESRKNPIAHMESSRGCPYGCIYCNKKIFGHQYRFKSPKRVVDEMEYLLGLGFKEIHIIDDVFSANRERAIEVANEIIKRGLKFPWFPRGGFRVDCVDLELLQVLKKAGCYRVPFGIESGNERILKSISKGITKNIARKAVKIAKKVGMEIECYFMIGFPSETEEDIIESIRFAKQLNPDWVKFAIHIPLPGTRIWDRMIADNQIKSFDWSLYNFATTPREIYTHDTLDWDTLEKYYTKSHRDFYLRPTYIAKHIWHSIKNKTFFYELKNFLKVGWF